MDLAERAGVGERTIRNAESGHIIEGSTASYLAGALEVELDSILKHTSSVSIPFNISDFAVAFRTAFFYGNNTNLMEMLTPNCSWQIIGLPERQDIRFVDGSDQIGFLFASTWDDTKRNANFKWQLGKESHTVLSDTFVLLSTYSFSNSQSHAKDVRCVLIGTTQNGSCAKIIQIWDENSPLDASQYSLVIETSRNYIVPE